MCLAVFLQPLGAKTHTPPQFPSLAKPVWKPPPVTSHGHFTPRAFPLCCWNLLKSGPTWASPRIVSVLFKGSQIHSQKLIKMEFHALLVPLGDVKGDPIQSPGNPSQKRISFLSLKPRPPGPRSFGSAASPEAFSDPLSIDDLTFHSTVASPKSRARGAETESSSKAVGVRGPGWGVGAKVGAGVRLQSQFRQQRGWWWKERGRDFPSRSQDSSCSEAEAAQERLSHWPSGP